MDTIRKIEKTAASWYRDVPHLPVSAQKWLAVNMWWLVLIFVILGAIGALQLLSAVLLPNFLLIGSYSGLIGTMAGATLFAPAFLVTLLISIIAVILSAMAVTPLRTLLKKGWTLLFSVVLLSVASAVFGFILQWNLGSLLSSLLSAAIGGYILFEIRTYFKESHS